MYCSSSSNTPILYLGIKFNCPNHIFIKIETVQHQLEEFSVEEFSVEEFSVKEFSIKE